MMRRLDPLRSDRRPARAKLAAWAALLALATAGCGGPGTTESRDANAPAAAPAPSLDAPDEHLTSPIATVNGQAIYLSTYFEILEALREQIPSGDPDSVERYLGARTTALDKAIDEEMLYQEAVKRGYEPKPAEIAEIYTDRVREAGSEARYLESVKSRQLSKKEVLHSYSKALAIDRLVKGEIESKISVTDDEVRAYYETHPEYFTPDRWLKIGQIFVNAPLDWPASKRSEALTRLTRAYDKLRQGRSFESLARDVSEDGSGPEGGMLGFVKRGGLAQQLDRAVFALKPGEITGIIESEKGYHIMKAYESRGGELEPFEKVKDQARQKLILKKRGDAIAGLLSDLRKTAKVERLGATPEPPGS